MAQQMIPIEQAGNQLSTIMKQRIAAGTHLNNNFSDGVRDSFPILSIKGKVFRARISGEEQVFLDPATRAPMQFMDIVLVNASRQLSKTYYEKGFTEGDFDPPQCWSLDSIRPDPSVVNKVSLTCQLCPMNQFGSRITEDGKPAKACQDARRVAVVMPHELNKDTQLLMLLRIPQSSLKNLKLYAQLLERHGVEPGGCITRVTFDYTVAFPKLQFAFVAPLNDQQYTKVIEIATEPNTDAMLKAPDFENAPSIGAAQGAVAQQTTAAAATEPVLAGAVQQAAPIVQPVTQHVVTQPDPTVVLQSVQQATGVTEEVKNWIITLPDGKKFDTRTNAYVEEEEPEEEEAAPEPDPTTIKLPDGRYYNAVQQKYVTGPNKGDPEAGAEPAPEPAKKKRRSSAEVAAEKAAKEAAAKQDAAPQQTAAAQDEGPVLGNVGGAAAKPDTVAHQANGAGTPANTVGAAPASLEDLLGKLVPPSGGVTQ